MASGTATVKAVTSGDSLVLVGSAKTGPPPELTLTLSSLQAPKLARGSDQTNEVQLHDLMCLRSYTVFCSRMRGPAENLFANCVSVKLFASKSNIT